MNQSAENTTGLHRERDRTKIPQQYTWRLSDIYPDDAAWKSAKELLVKELPGIETFRGKLASAPKVLLECFDLLNRLSKEYTRLYCYASMNSDLDTRASVYLGMEQEMSQIGADFSSRSSYIQPEIIATLNREEIDRFLKAEQGLLIYRHDLDDLLRRKEHTRTEGEEKIIADAGLFADGAQSIYSIFSDADFPFPEVTLSDGAQVKLDKAAFSLHRTSSNSEDRRKVFSAFFAALHRYRRTFGAQLSAEVRKNVFYMKSRRYNSCLEKALDGGNIPVAVYHSLIDGVNRNLSTFHRYLDLRRRMMKLDALHHYDLYAPLVENLDLEYTIEESMEHILASLAPLGSAYVDVARKGFSDRWVDVFPNEGKRSGAYSNGAVYDVHPYMLLNYNGKYDDMSTLAHELGHTMHSHLSNTHQPYATSHYSIFVAEVASTFNEALLMDYMLKRVTDDRVRLTLLGNYLDGFRGTVFRQTQFSEFELNIHELCERGEPLTGDGLSELYLAMARRYYGHDRGVCIVDDEVQSEWAFIPHFYYNFYVYQYATSFTASAALSEQVLLGDTGATGRYLELLSAGGSDYPINLLKRAGVDLTTSGPFDLTMRKMNRIMDEMEEILERMPGGSGIRS
jgi:oligoendopeptidase F